MCPLGWRRWAYDAILTPKVDYMATIRHAVRAGAARQHARTLRPHVSPAASAAGRVTASSSCRRSTSRAPRPGFLIDTSSSMQDTQLATSGCRTRRPDASARLRRRGRRRVLRRRGARRQDGLQRRAGASCTAAAARTSAPGSVASPIARAVPSILLVIVTDCQTPWPDEAPPFPVITIRVGDGLPPPWGDRGMNKVITIEDPDEVFEQSERQRKRRWRADR